jgi:lysozyme family protein
MANFAQAIPWVLQHEGGFVNNPNDPGGATNYGISLYFLENHPQIGDLNHDGAINIADIRSMTLTQAESIYQTQWWDFYHYGNVNNQQLATKVFDTSVNMGPSPAHRFLQQAVNAVANAGLTVDGQLGPMTFTAVNNLTDSQVGLVVTQYCTAQWAYYQHLIAQNNALSEFANGWRNRAFSVC